MLCGDIPWSSCISQDTRSTWEISPGPSLAGRLGRLRGQGGRHGDSNDENDDETNKKHGC